MICSATVPEGYPEEKETNETLKNALSGLGYSLFWKPETASTNDWALEACREGCAAPALFLTDFQTSGKGRLGRTWSAGKGTSLTFSILIRPECRTDRIPCYTEVFGLSLCTALRHFGVSDALIKWPNDIVVSGKKISGTLTESSSGLVYIVIGTGVNLTKHAYPEELAYKATSLEEHLSCLPDRTALLTEILTIFEKDKRELIRNGGMNSLKERYEELLVNIGRETAVTVQGEKLTGRSAGIDEAGQLVFVKENGETVLIHSGEASVSGIY